MIIIQYNFIVIHCAILYRSNAFRPIYGRIHELRAFIPSGTPFLALTATATSSVKLEVIEKLDMTGCANVSVSPNRPNIFYEVKVRTDLSDLDDIVQSLKVSNIKAERIIIYCRSLDMCADLYEYFQDALQHQSYYPLSAEHVASNRLYGMFHAYTPQENKSAILSSLGDHNGVVRVVFATVALGMGVNMAGVNRIIHYGAPHSIEDYMQESGRAGRSGEQALSIVYWKPNDAPLRKELKSNRDREIAAVRHYLENSKACRRVQLLNYFDPVFTESMQVLDKSVCCDVCKNEVVKE